MNSKDTKANHHGRQAALGRKTTAAANRMSKAEIDAFLGEPFIGRLATVRPDGFPHLTPIWPLWDGEVIAFSLAESRMHIRNLRIDPKATILVDEDWRPRTKRYASGAAGVTIRGEVSVLDFDISKQLHHEMYAAHAVKFLDGAQNDPAYWRDEGGERYHICHLRPVTIVSWDFRKNEDGNA